MPRDKVVHGTVVLAEHQSNGRGQYSRSWEAEPGQNLTFSMVFEPKRGERVVLLTLACALAAKETAEMYCEKELSVKWPNDIMCGSGKVGGILTETQFSGNSLSRVIVGIGLNINQCEFGGELKDSASSLRLIKGDEINREEFFVQLLQKTEYYYRLWSQYDNKLVRKINAAMRGVGKWGKLIRDGRELEERYKFLGVDERGSFRVLTEDLDLEVFEYEQVRFKEQNQAVL